MKLKGYFFIVIAFAYNNSYGQAPAQPVNPTPPDNNISATNNPGLCADVSDPNGGTIQVKYFGKAKSSAGSEKFTVVFLPDTQYYTEEPQGAHGGNIGMFNAQTAWIANNRLSRNIVYVGQLGDCVQNGDDPPHTNKEIEWQRAQSAMAPIENPSVTGLPQGIPFGICVGNHEQTPIYDPNGTTIYYNKYFGIDHFTGKNYYGGHYGSNNDNHYQLFSASGIDFLVISLEFDQTPGFSVPGAALDWAEGLVQNNPGRKVIVMTHWVLNEDASFGPQGQAIYNRLRQYPNFAFFIGGHMSSINGGEARRTDIYNGNKVHSILSDYQHRTGGGNGLLRIFEFDPSLNKVSVQTYSPYTNSYETDASSQFELSFNMLPSLSQLNDVTSGTKACYTWPNLLFNTEYEWNMELYDGQNITTSPTWSFTTLADPLPVTLLDFFAGIENDKIKLSWKTASEFNNDRFEIERSGDGNNFVKIGTRKGYGISTILQDYNFFDEQPLNGKNFYRLKQVDIDDRFEYSIIRLVWVDSRDTWVIYPNPVNGVNINIYFATAIKERLEVRIYDMLGREILTATGNNSQGNLLIRHDLPPGFYMLRLVGETFQSTKKIMVGK